MMKSSLMKLATPLGELALTASDVGLTGIHFPNSPFVPPLRVAERGSGGEDRESGSGDGASGILARAAAQLTEYFARTRTTFDVPLAPTGSAFERRVWDALREIPYGSTLSYSELARRLGEPRVSRAVGAANAKNPIPIIVPCHRVIGAHGELTGFGGGIDRKRWLLEHEGALLALG